MEYFEYKVVSAKGKEEKGVIQGSSSVAIGASFLAKGFRIVNIEPMQDFMGIKKILMTNFFKKVKQRDCKDFCDQLAFMLETDISLNQALLVLRDKSESSVMQIIASPLCEYIQNGQTLHTAMERTGYFDKLIIYQILAGEESGEVVGALKNISKQIESDLDFKSKIKGAAAYPVMIVVMMVVMIMFMLMFVVPKISGTITEMGGELPVLTKIVIALSNSAAYFFPLTLVIIIMAVVLYNRERARNHDFCKKVDELKLKVPLIGKMIKKISFRNFCQRLSVMQSAGLTLAEGLNMTSLTIGNTYISDCIYGVKQLVEQQGVSLSFAMNNYPIFDGIMIQMIEIGGKTGQMVDVLDVLSERYRKEVENYLKIAISLSEPIMIALITIIVGILVVAMYLPMLGMVDTLQIQ